jgi:hypothetical protein
VIGGLRLGVALGAARFGATDRGYARGLCSGGRREGCGRCLRLRAGTAAGALGMPRFAFTALIAVLGWARLALAALAALGGARLALTPRLAAAA